MSNCNVTSQQTYTIQESSARGGALNWPFAERNSTGNADEFCLQYSANSSAWLASTIQMLHCSWPWQRPEVVETLHSDLRNFLLSCSGFRPLQSSTGISSGTGLCCEAIMSLAAIIADWNSTFSLFHCIEYIDRKARQSSQLHVSAAKIWSRNYEDPPESARACLSKLFIPWGLVIGEQNETITIKEDLFRSAFNCFDIGSLFFSNRDFPVCVATGCTVQVCLRHKLESTREVWTDEGIFFCFVKLKSTCWVDLVVSNSWGRKWLDFLLPQYLASCVFTGRSQLPLRFSSSAVAISVSTDTGDKISVLGLYLRILGVQFILEIWLLANHEN